MREQPDKRRGPIGWLVEQYKSQLLDNRGKRSIVFWPGHLLFLAPLMAAIAVAFFLPFLGFLLQIIQQVREWFQ